MAKKSNRVKSDSNLIAVADWPHADNLMRRMGDAQLKIQAAEAKAAESIADAKAALAAESKAHHELIKQITKSLEAFAAHHRDDFGGKKTRALNFGDLGWRLSTSIRAKKDVTVELIKQIFKGRAKQYLHVKETPDMEALAKLTDEQLAEVQARRDVKDGFFVEPTIPQAVDYPENK